MLGFAHDWADQEATLRSWELFARYVIPELQGTTRNLRASQQYLHDNQAELMGGASRAVMSKIMGHEGAAAAMATTMANMKAQKDAGGNGDDATFRPGVGVPHDGRVAAGGLPTEDQLTVRGLILVRTSGQVGERDGGGVADVQRVDAGGDRDAHAAGRGGHRAPGQPGSLGAEQHRDAGRDGERPQVVGRRRPV